MTGMQEKKTANVLDLYYLIVYIIGLQQRHDDAWKEVQMMISLTVQQTAAFANLDNWVALAPNNNIPPYSATGCTKAR